MSFRIVKVKTSEEIDQVLRLRHRVFVEEEGLLEANEDRRIFDRYDAYPSTNMYAAMVDGEMIGSVRVTLDSQVGVPADKYFAYRAGEQVVKSGEVASEAFVVIDGEAEVKLSESGAVFTRLTQSNVFGELALIAGEPRSADVFAPANFQLMALSKEAFTRVFLHDPQKALRLLQSMAERNMDLTNRLS